MATAIARNSRAQVIVYEQTAIETVAPGGSPGMKLHLIDSDLAPRQDLFESNVINGTRMAVEPFLDAIEVSGGYTIQPDPIEMGWHLKWAIGAPVTTGAGPYTHTFKVLTTALTPLTVEKFLPDIAQVFRMWGLKINQFSFDVGRSGVLQVPFQFMGLGINEATSAIDAAPYYPQPNVFRAPAVTMSEGGVAFARAQRFAATFDNGNEGIPVLGNSGAFYDVVEGILRPTGTLTMLLADRGVYDKAKAGTESSLLLTFPCSDGVSSLAVSWPEVKYALHGPSIRGGTGPIPVDVAWRAFYGNDAGNSEVIFTLINNHPSYAAAIPA